MINAIIIRRLIQVSNAHADPFCGYEYMKFGFRSLFIAQCNFYKPSIIKITSPESFFESVARASTTFPWFTYGTTLLGSGVVGCHRGDF